MGRFYPEAATTTKPEPPVTTDAIVGRALAAFDAGTLPSRAIGGVLGGVDASRGFRELWGSIKKVRAALLAVDPSRYADANAYKAALKKVKAAGVPEDHLTAILKNLDTTAWYNGIKDLTGGANYTEVKAKWQR